MVHDVTSNIPVPEVMTLIWWSVSDVDIKKKKSRLLFGPRALDCVVHSKASGALSGLIVKMFVMMCGLKA